MSRLGSSPPYHLVIDLWETREMMRSFSCRFGGGTNAHRLEWHGGQYVRKQGSVERLVVWFLASSWLEKQGKKNTGAGRWSLYLERNEQYGRDDNEPSNILRNVIEFRSQQRDHLNELVRVPREIYEIFNNFLLYLTRISQSRSSVSYHQLAIETTWKWIHFRSLAYY